MHAEQLISLTAGVSFDGSLLGTPTGLAAGAIVPDPLNSAADFQTTATASEADAAFTTSSRTSAGNIASNGVFYRFEISATGAGSGEIGLDPLALVAEQFDPQNPDSPLLRSIDIGPALSFAIVAPEPRGLLALGLAVALARPRRIKAA